LQATTEVMARYPLKSESDTQALAKVFAESMELCNALNTGVVVYLEGDLGAGKSFFSRAFIQAFLPKEKVKSPTYTIVESYNSSKVSIHHFDLYRLCDPEELEYLAIRDLLVDRYVALVEWPSKGVPLFPKADILIRIQHQDEVSQDFASDERLFTMTAVSKMGEQVIQKVGEQFAHPVTE